ncbi:MAG: glycosyltransferase [Patescibacteria group bacterium]
MRENKSVLLVGGGSGGHIVPIFELSQRIRHDHPGVKVYVIGGSGPIEKVFFSCQESFFILYTGKLRRVLTWRNFTELALLVFGIFQALYLLIRLKPKVIFIKGGYVSLPIILWARILAIPYFVHESDIAIGITNKFGSQGAKKTFLGFPKKYYKDKIDIAKAEFVGQLMKSGAIGNDHFNFGFGGRKPVVLITGGSQGSKSLNKAIFQIISELIKKYDVIHQTGSLGYRDAINTRSLLAHTEKKSYFVTDFLGISVDADLMRAAEKSADLVITRAGATTIAELSALHKPMILVPYKHASLDHQSKNALALEDSGAAVVIEDDERLHTNLLHAVDTLFGDRLRMKKMGEKAGGIFPEDGISKVIENIINFEAK